MRLVYIAVIASLAFGEDPQPPVVAPGTNGGAPSDAVVLFDGTSTAKWVRENGSPTGCTAEKGVMNCATGAGDAWTAEKFGSAQIHLEFFIPSMPGKEGQMKGNSGVYLQGRYEVQILDSYKNPTYASGSLGALYGQYAPLANAARPPEQWQTYDIIFHAPKCDAGGGITGPATLTVLLNGVLVQDHVAVKERKDACQPGPLMLQDHSGFPRAPHTVMKFRNIWLRRL
ncbi:MAG: DUF1080 domain-containing protein [Bryobacterales bacterium]|nr:DUF1080 domain-containing protein [Bryobacterales bacterium]